MEEARTPCPGCKRTYKHVKRLRTHIAKDHPHIHLGPARPKPPRKKTRGRGNRRSKTRNRAHVNDVRGARDDPIDLRTPPPRSPSFIMLPTPPPTEKRGARDEEPSRDSDAQAGPTWAVVDANSSRGRPIPPTSRSAEGSAAESDGEEKVMPAAEKAEKVLKTATASHRRWNSPEGSGAEDEDELDSDMATEKSATRREAFWGQPPGPPQPDQTPSKTKGKRKRKEEKLAHARREKKGKYKATSVEVEVDAPATSSQVGSAPSVPSPKRFIAQVRAAAESASSHTTDHSKDNLPGPSSAGNSSQSQSRSQPQSHPDKTTTNALHLSNVPTLPGTTNLSNTHANITNSSSAMVSEALGPSTPANSPLNPPPVARDAATAASPPQRAPVATHQASAVVGAHKCSLPACEICHALAHIIHSLHSGGMLEFLAQLGLATDGCAANQSHS